MSRTVSKVRCLSATADRQEYVDPSSREFGHRHSCESRWASGWAPPSHLGPSPRPDPGAGARTRRSGLALAVGVRVVVARRTGVLALRPVVVAGCAAELAEEAVVAVDVGACAVRLAASRRCRGSGATDETGTGNREAGRDT